MIIVMRAGAAAAEVDHVVSTIQALGFRPHLSRGEEATVIGVIGDERKLDPARFQSLPGVERVIPILKPFKLASRDFKKDPSVVRVDDHPVGNQTLTIMAGPCAVESIEQMMECARKVKSAGAHILRGGAYKPRTSPYSFQGLGKKGLEILSEIKKVTGLKIVTELMSVQDLPAVAEVADLIQIGARNMQNFALLDEVGRQPKPVLLKRGLMSTLEELLLSAEYILSRGNHNVILCERGIRTFEKYTRNTLDISAVPVIKHHSHLPIIIDPSHASGTREYVTPLARAAIAAGADGIMVEVHPAPEQALCDGQESLTPDEFARMMDEIRVIARALNRDLS